MPGPETGKPLRPWSLRGRPELLALIVLVVVLLLPIHWGLDPQWSWDVDNTAPGSVLRAIAARFGPTWSSSYGPVSYMVQAIPMVPLLVWFKVSGELGVPTSEPPWGFAHPGLSVAALTLAARAVSVLLATLLVVFVLRELRRSSASRHAWLAPVLFIGSATFVYYSRTTNVDIHYLFWLGLAFHLAERAERARGLFAAGAFAALAVCTKEQAAPFALVAVLLASRRGLRGVSPGLPAGLRSAILPIVAALLAYLIVWRLPMGVPGWLEHHRFVFADARYERTFAASAWGTLQLAARTLELFPLALGLPVLAGVVLALARRVSWRGLEARAIACALYLVTFLGGVGYVYPRFLLPLLLLFVPLTIRAVASLRPSAARATAVAFCVLAVAGGPVLDWVQCNDPRLALERWLAPRIRAGADVELAGNPHFQARVPGGRFRLVKPEALRREPRSPSARIVLQSSIDRAFFERDPSVDAVWGAVLRDPSRYAPEVVFEPPAIAWLVTELPVAPRVSAWVSRAPDPSRVP